jgi:hypothetical protein
MYLSNMVPTQTPAKTIQISVLRRTSTGALDSGSIKYRSPIRTFDRRPKRPIVPMTDRKSRTLELLAFDEYCRFDTSAFFYRIKRASLYPLKESRSIKTAIFIES